MGRRQSYQRQAAAQAKAYAEWAERQQAADEVSDYEAELAVLTSVHKGCGPEWNWHAVSQEPAPQPPAYVATRTESARAAAAAYVPDFIENLFEPLFGTVTRARKAYSDLIEFAMRDDANEYASLHRAYLEQVAAHQWRQQVARGVLQADPEAYRAVLEHLAPLAQLRDPFMIFPVLDEIAPDAVVVECLVDDVSIVPEEKKGFTATGKLSVKAFSETSRWTHYQDYVCGCALRVAREVFAMLPVPRVVVNAATDNLDTSTGRNDWATILAVSFQRESFSALNFERLDPSDAVSRFDHRMQFKKTYGFAPVSPITLDDAFATAG
jgi:hypothetical protein